MGQVRFHKVVSALPSPLEKDGLYLVRTGEGFDLYVSDSTGAIAHKVNTGAAVQDTGWRNVTALLQFPQELNGTGVFVRRVGDLCYARIQAPYSYRQSNRTTSRGALPVGLRPHVLIGSVFTNGSGQQIAFFAINTNGQVSGQILTTGSGGLVPQGLIVYTPSGPFPSELPGSPSNY